MCTYHASIIKEEVKKLPSVYIMRQSSRKKLKRCGVYISCVNHKGGSYKVAVGIDHASIIKEEVIKLWCVYIMRQS